MDRTASPNASCRRSCSGRTAFFRYRLTNVVHNLCDLGNCGVLATKDIRSKKIGETSAKTIDLSSCFAQGMRNEMHIRLKWLHSLVQLALCWLLGTSVQKKSEMCAKKIESEQVSIQ